MKLFRVICEVAILFHLTSGLAAENPIRPVTGILAEGSTTITKYANSPSNDLQSSLSIQFSGAYFPDSAVYSFRSNASKYVISERYDDGGATREIWKAGPGSLDSFLPIYAAGGGTPLELTLATPYAAAWLNKQRFDLYSSSGKEPVVSNDAGITVISYPVGPDKLDRTVKVNSNGQLVSAQAVLSGKPFQIYTFSNFSPQYKVPLKLKQMQYVVPSGKKLMEVNTTVRSIRPLGKKESASALLKQITADMERVPKPR